MADTEHRGKRFIKKLDNFLRPIEAAAAVVGGVVMLAAMVLTSADALLRYTINKPLTFNYFVTENYLMVALVCMPLAWAFRTGGYIRIMFLYAQLPGPAARLLLRAGILASFLLIADLAWLAGLNWYKAWTTNEIIIDVVDFRMAWSWIWVPVGLGLLALRLLLTTFGPPEGLLAQHDPEEQL